MSSFLPIIVSCTWLPRKVVCHSLGTISKPWRTVMYGVQSVKLISAVLIICCFLFVKISQDCGCQNLCRDCETVMYMIGFWSSSQTCHSSLLVCQHVATSYKCRLQTVEIIQTAGWNVSILLYWERRLFAVQFSPSLSWSTLSAPTFYKQINWN